VKLGEAIDAVNAISFLVGASFSTPAYPFDETIKVLQAVDGTIYDVVNFGARQHRECSFDLTAIPKADYYTLKTYLEANGGKKIRVQFENTGERVFGEQSPYNGPTVYATLVEAEALGEVDFSNLFFNLSRAPYGSLAQAKAAGAPTINYGVFLNELIGFGIVAMATFLIVKQLNRLQRQQTGAPSASAALHPCPYCLSSIPLGAARCAHCTSILQPAT